MSDDARYEAARQRVQAKKAFLGHALIYLVINVVFLIVAGWSWLWVSLFWGIGLAVQGFATYFSGSDWWKGWEDRQIQKELARNDPKPAAAPPAAPAAPHAPSPAAESDTTQT